MLLLSKSQKNYQFHMTIERYGIHNVIRFHFLLSFSLLRPFYMDMKNVNGILQQKLNTIQSSMKAK